MICIYTSITTEVIVYTYSRKGNECGLCMQATYDKLLYTNFSTFTCMGKHMQLYTV